MENYTSLNKLGKGGYASVFSAVNSQNESCAIKVNRRDDVNVFGTIASIREYDTLIKVQNCDFCIGLKDIIENTKEGEDSIIFELEKGICDGREFIKNNNIEHSDRVKFLLHLALGIEFLHSRGIIHYDIKPQNTIIFNNEKNQFHIAKITDFGMSMRYSTQNFCDHDMYTAWYRAPEIINNETYSFGIDVWAFGITAIECMRKSKNPLIIKYEPKDILKKINHCFPKDKNADYDLILQYTKKEIKFRGYDVFTDMLKSIMHQNPKNRKSISDVINSTFFSEHRDLIDICRSNLGINSRGEWITKITPVVNIWDFKDRPLMINRIKSYNFGDVITFHSCDLMDRYMFKIKPVKLTEYEMLILINTVVFMVVKYYMVFINTIKPNIMYKNHDIDMVHHDMIKLEKKIINELNHDIIRESYTEVINFTHPLTEKECCNLFSLICNLNAGSYNVKDLILEIRSLK